MYTVKKVKIQLEPIDLMEIHFLNYLYQKGSDYLCDYQKERLFELMNID